jgi:hypothetical protein
MLLILPPHYTTNDSNNRWLVCNFHWFFVAKINELRAIDMCVFTVQFCIAFLKCYSFPWHIKKTLECELGEQSVFSGQGKLNGLKNAMQSCTAAKSHA